MTTLVDLINEKRRNFAKFVSENTKDNVREKVEPYLKKMQSIDAVVFIKALTSQTIDSSDEDIVTRVLSLVNCKESDFEVEAKKKFLAYLHMFNEIRLLL